MQISLKTICNFSHAYRQTTDPMAFKFSCQNYTVIIKITVWRIFKLDQIDRIVWNYLSSCNTHQFKIIATIQFWDYLKTWFCKAISYKIWTIIAAFQLNNHRRQANIHCQNFFSGIDIMPKTTQSFFKSSYEYYI